jgi:hypothetical protein
MLLLCMHTVHTVQEALLVAVCALRTAHQLIAVTMEACMHAVQWQALRAATHRGFEPLPVQLTAATLPCTAPQSISIASSQKLYGTDSLQ